MKNLILTNLKIIDMSDLTPLETFNVSKDIAGLVIQTGSVIVSLGTLAFALKAIKLTTYQIEQTIQEIKHAERTYSYTLDWNKKMATDAILETKPDRKVTNRLNEKFHTINFDEPIKDIVDIVDKDEDLELDIHHLLNVYERLSRGMQNDIYVEAMIKDGLRNTFIKIYNNYSLYIEDRQKKHPKAFIAFENYARKWKKEKEEEEKN